MHSITRIIMSRNAYIGLSSTTGQLADNHDILTLLTYGATSDPNQIGDEAKAQEKQNDEKESTELYTLLKENGIDFGNLTPNEVSFLLVQRNIFRKLC